MAFHAHTGRHSIDCDTDISLSKHARGTSHSPFFLLRACHRTGGTPTRAHLAIQQISSLFACVYVTRATLAMLKHPFVDRQRIDVKRSRFTSSLCLDFFFQFAQSAQTGLTLEAAPSPVKCHRLSITSWCLRVCSCVCRSALWPIRYAVVRSLVPQTFCGKIWGNLDSRDKRCTYSTIPT